MQLIHRYSESVTVGGRTVRPHRIFVVDDNLDTANTLAKLLRLEGHEVVVINDGQTAIEQALALKPAVVFLDIALRGVNGYDVARQIRTQPGGEAATLVAVTGYGHPSDRLRAFEAGFDYHFTKPVGLADLIAVIPSRSRDAR